MKSELSVAQVEKKKEYRGSPLFLSLSAEARTPACIKRVVPVSREYTHGAASFLADGMYDVPLKKILFSRPQHRCRDGIAILSRRWGLEGRDRIPPYGQADDGRLQPGQVTRPNGRVHKGAMRSPFSRAAVAF